jgi:proteasome component ECM29
LVKTEAEAVRGYAYVACGLIAKKGWFRWISVQLSRLIVSLTKLAVPSVVQNDASVLELLFKNMEEEPQSVRVYTQDALSSMIDVYRDENVSAEVKAKIDEIVLSSVEKVRCPILS